MTIVGISGKIGSGKNYLATALTKELISRGYTVNEGSFATTLKEELASIMRSYWTWLETLPIKRLAPLFSKNIFKQISNDFDIPYHQVKTLIGFIHKDMLVINRIEDISGYSRTEGVRRGLQYLGTDIRRAVDDNYWVKLFHKSLIEADFIFVTDVRFPNEADSVLASKGVALRMEVPADVIASRTNDRDGLKYSTDAISHPSETALDKYPHFDKIIGVSFDTNELVDYLIQKHQQ